MRDPSRIGRIVALLGEVWMSRPDMRLGQLLIALETTEGTSLFYVEDEEWERLLTQVSALIEKSGGAMS